MIFGRKRNDAADEEPREDLEVVDEVLEEEDPLDVPEAGTQDAQASAGEELTEEAAAGEGSGANPAAGKWQEWDAAFDRDWGPFDIEEVDLEADDTKRLDLGTIVVTPFDNMKMQLQVDKSKQKVQAILVADGASAIEVAAFAGPMRTSLLPEIRDEIISATEREKGKVQVVRGPFGAELRRRLPVTDPKGNAAIHVSRTWLVSGPGWVLRGVLMGRAALEPDNEEAQLTLFEFFSNLVVRRGTSPAAPGSLLAITVPTGEKQPEQ